jgi:predicted dehydrogenase
MATRFSIIGGAGFRAQYYLRIAEALPNEFQISGMVVRDEENGKAMERQWNVATYRTLDQLLLSEQPDFVVVSVGWAACRDYLLTLAKNGIPALSETPPASSLDDLLDLHQQLSKIGARVQVAEQYPFHPNQQARMAVIGQGLLGKVTEATVSVSHLYHAVALLRQLLGIRFEEVRIRGMRFESSWLAGPNRKGPPTEEKLIPLQRDLAWLEFGDRLGIYDFTKDQHRSWIRSNHVSVRGERGEIFDQRLMIMKDYVTPLHLEFKRINKGEAENQEGYFLKGIMAGERWLYENPFLPARLYDDEIAIATCLRRMTEYVEGGSGFYDIAEAAQDHYLGMAIERAVLSGETVTAVPCQWAKR